MMKYELTFLLNEESELKNIKKLITDASGSILKEEPWGKKALAYPINKNHEAQFYNYKLELDHKTISELKRKLNFNEKLLRYLLLKEE